MDVKDFINLLTNGGIPAVSLWMFWKVTQNFREDFRTVVKENTISITEAAVKMDELKQMIQLAIAIGQLPSVDGRRESPPRSRPSTDPEK